VGEVEASQDCITSRGLFACRDPAEQDTAESQAQVSEIGCRWRTDNCTLPNSACLLRPDRLVGTTAPQHLVSTDMLHHRSRVCAMIADHVTLNKMDVQKRRLRTADRTARRG
jgi:hypothetical protein